MLLIQFAKWPVPGKVKTRIAKSVGDERACEIHLALTRQVLHNLRRTTDAQVELWFDSIPEASSDEFKFGKSLWTELEEAGIPVRLQQGDDLGARMYHALSDGLERQSAKKREQKVVIVGSDCPTVDDRYLQLARDRLDQCDLVLGPSDDGGYVLIGVSRINNALLCDTPWGTETVLQTTVQRAQDCGLKYDLLPITWDIDDIDDYERWVRSRAQIPPFDVVKESMGFNGV